MFSSKTAAFLMEELFLLWRETSYALQVGFVKIEEVLFVLFVLRRLIHRIYANLMHTSIFKTLKPKKVFAGECNAQRQKMRSLQQWVFITNSVLQKKKHNSLINQRKKADPAGLDHPIYRWQADALPLCCFALWQGLSIWSN
jgi:hypothetical protein